MFMNNLTSYTHYPPTKIANYHIENIQGDMSLARPLKKWEGINDRSRPPSPVFKRKIRSEDVNVRQRSVAEDVKGRLTDFESEEYMRKINEDAKKFALIGEKVITDLFKVQVPDPSDKEYINKRSEVMANENMSKEEADMYLKENFREQYTTKKSVDITRMDAPISTMMSAFQQLNSSMERSPENVARMKNFLNKMLLKEGVRTPEEMKLIMQVLIDSPFYRIDYRPNNPLKMLGVLSNVVVGNVSDQQDVNVESKQPSPNTFKLLEDERSLGILAKFLDKEKMKVENMIKEEQKNDVVADVNVLVNDEVDDLEDSGDDLFGVTPFSQLSEVSGLDDDGETAESSEEEERVTPNVKSIKNLRRSPPNLRPRKPKTEGKGLEKKCPKGKKNCDCDVHVGSGRTTQTKPKRKESEWIKFVKVIRKSENLTYKDALKVASLVRKK